MEIRGKREERELWKRNENTERYMNTSFPPVMHDKVGEAGEPKSGALDGYAAFARRQHQPVMERIPIATIV